MHQPTVHMAEGHLHVPVTQIDTGAESAVRG